MPAPAPTRAWGWLAGHPSDVASNGAGTLARVDTEAVFAASARHRRAVADVLESLDENQLALSSLCAGWDVRTVAAHLASAIAPSNRAFMGAVLRHGGNLHHAIDAVARKTARLPVADIVEILRRHADSRFTPPVTGPRGPLTDVLVHTGDMRIPLGLSHNPVGAHVRAALDFVSMGRPVGFVPRGRLAGLQLVAEDLDWRWGAGPDVCGRGIDVLMVACGRASVLPQVHGPGVETVSARLNGGRGARHR